MGDALGVLELMALLAVLFALVWLISENARDDLKRGRSFVSAGTETIYITE